MRNLAVATAWAFLVDRVDEGGAVLLDERGAQIAVPLRSLPPGAREGDVLRAGRLDPPERARWLGQVRRARARLSRARADGEGPCSP